VSAPTFVARKRNEPSLLSVAPTTVSPGFFSTGIGSPVSIDSSTAEAPSSTVPSTGTFSPGRTMTMSPTTTCSTGTSISSPPRVTRAVLAASPMSARMASDVRPLARASSSFPSSTKVMSSAEVSKKTGSAASAGTKVAATL
jgi:hypothetical protein